MGHGGLEVRKTGPKVGQSLLTMSPYHYFSTADLGVEHPWFLPSRRASGLAKALMSFRNLRPSGPWLFSPEPPDKFTFFTSNAVLAIRRHGD